MPPVQAPAVRYRSPELRNDISAVKLGKLILYILLSLQFLSVEPTERQVMRPQLRDRGTGARSHMPVRSGPFRQVILRFENHETSGTKRLEQGLSHRHSVRTSFGTASKP
jgi:hypothetical protein